MAITTLDQAASGAKPPAFFAKTNSAALVVGRPYNPWYLSGVPASAVVPSPGLAGAALTFYDGQLPVPAASNNTHLHRFSGVSATQGGMLLLCDRLWHNSGLSVTTTGGQTVNSVALPARDSNGTINGEQVYIGLEVTGTTGAGAATPSIIYTTPTNIGARSSTTVDVYAASSVVGSFYRFGLQASDTGVKSVQTFSLGVSMTSGSIALVAYRVLATLELVGAGIPNAVDFLTGGGPRCYDNTVPFLLFLPSTTAATQLTGTAVFTQG